MAVINGSIFNDNNTFNGFPFIFRPALVGTNFNDTIRGFSGNDILRGNGGNDWLDGGTGNDNMNGGFGNDTYIVDSAGDVAAEVAGGVDTVRASVSHTLSANLENLILTGAASISGTGNAKANTLTGNNSNNILRGLAGNDTLIGNGGNDWLDGGTGNDNMNGGFGNDTYIVDSVGDVAAEVAGGVDTVRSSVNHTLSANLENLILTGTAIVGNGNAKANRISGNSRNNTLRGNAGNDTLRGNAGNDTLVGGSGNDVLIGGTGKDVLIDGQGKDVFKYFNTVESRVGAARRDIVRDLDRGFDKIDLSFIDANRNRGGNQAFKFIGTNGFTGTTGEVRYYRRGSSSIVQVDIHGDGNRTADMEIQLNGTSFISASDFVL